MFKHILVPLDGSRLAEDVLEPVAALASRLGSRVTLLHVLEREPPAHIHGETHITDAAGGAQYLGALADRLQARIGDVEVHLHSRPVDDVAAAINAHVSEFGIDLIAMCRHGRSGIRQALVGSIAQRILKAGGAAILLRTRPRDDPEAFHPERILAPLDPDHDATRGLETASALAIAFGARLHLLTAVPDVARSRRAPVPLSLSPRAEAAEVEMQIEDTDRFLTERAAQLQELGLTVTTEVRRGEPVEAVLAAADTLPADLIVMTTHARTGVEGWYRASTGYRVISKASQTLLLLREF